MEDVVWGSRALVASSQSSICGSEARALAIATLCFCPPESCAGYAFALSASPTISRSSRAFALASAFFFPWMYSGKQTFSSTFFCMSRLKCWKIIPIFSRSLRSSFGENSLRDFPSINTFPSDGTSRKFIHRTRVLFPAPDIPMIP